MKKENKKKAASKKKVVEAPKKKNVTKTVRFELPEVHTLLGARQTFVLGDIFYIKKKYVIKSLTTTEDSDDIKVMAEELTKVWLK